MRRASRIYGQISGEQHAAAFAYYVLFSLFPMMALALSIGSFFFDGHDIIGAVNGILPLGDGERQVLWETVVSLEAARARLGLLAVVVLLWCSLHFFQALVRGVNRAWHTALIPWWQMPLKNLAMTAILGSALFAGILIPAALQAAGKILRWAHDFLAAHFPMVDFVRTAWLLDSIRFLLASVVLFYSFSMLYMLAPRLKVRFSQVWLPAVVVTVALEACQAAFVNVIPRVMNYGLYGAVGGMMFLLMWTYFSGMIIVFGGCLCAAGAGVTPSTRGN